MISFISSLDQNFEMFLLSLRDPFLVQFFIWISEFGSAVTIAGLTLIAIIILVYLKKWPSTGGLIASVLGSTIITFVLKELVARIRPTGSIPAYIETGFSFPSGHATRAVAFFVFLLWLIWDYLSPIWRKVATGIVAVLTLAIGFSRLYLGVHYPSDVIAGYLVGAVFVIVGIKVANKLSRLNSSGAEQSNL